MRWPGHIPAGQTCNEIVTTMDLLPTFARLAGTSLPPQPIDGHDVRPILFGEPDAKSPWDSEGFMYYRQDQLQAVRAGPWKLYLPLEKKVVANNRRMAAAKLELFNVADDVGETRELSADRPNVVRRLLSLADAARLEIGDTDRPGRGQRPAGHVDEPRGLVK